MRHQHSPALSHKGRSEQCGEAWEAARGGTRSPRGIQLSGRQNQSPAQSLEGRSEHRIHDVAFVSWKRIQWAEEWTYGEYLYWKGYVMLLVECLCERILPGDIGCGS